MELEELQTIKNQYLAKAEKAYGKLPEQCFDVEIEFWDDIPENENKPHCADCAKNTIFVNKHFLDNIEWTIFHEMEHIRTAVAPYVSDYKTGLVCNFNQYNHERICDALNEGLTEISVEKLLNKQSNKTVGYFETTQLTRQFGVIMGLKSDDELLNFYQPDGFDNLKSKFVERFGLEGYYFDSLIGNLDYLHKLHTSDLEKEFEKHGEIKSKPLGSEPCKNTITMREVVQQSFEIYLQLAKVKGLLSDKQCLSAQEKMQELSPYNQDINLLSAPA